MCKVVGLSFLLALTLLSPTVVKAANLGKLFIDVAPVTEGQLPDLRLEDSVKDLKERKGDFAIVSDESEADFRIVVSERKVSGQYKAVSATLSVRDGKAWKVVAKLDDGADAWGPAARRVMSNAQKWVKANAKK